MTEDHHEERRYYAFISYRHSDNRVEGRRWATWLHQAIETYEVPADIVGKTNQRGEEVPARIFPVFRDEEELPADSDLGRAVNEALDNSSTLIVLCSPRAADSLYVAREIDHFKKSGHADRIIAAIVDGEPNASLDVGKQADGFPPEAECFPQPLQFEYGPDGLPTEERAEPLAADFRVIVDGKPQEGWTSPEAWRQNLTAAGNLSRSQINAEVSAYTAQHHLMLLKVIAGILGVALGELTRRDQDYQLQLARKRASVLRRWLVAVGLLAVIAIGAGSIAYIQQQEAISERDRAEAMLDQVRENIDFMNYDLRDVLTRYVPTAERVDVLDRVDALVDLLQNQENLSDLDRRQLIVAYMNRADAILVSADLDPATALPLLLAALVIAEEHVASDSTNTLFWRDLALVHWRLGDLHLRRGDTVEAQRSLELALYIDEEQVVIEPTNTEFRRDVFGSHIWLGDLYLQTGDTAGTQRSYEVAQAIAEELVASDNSNTEFQRDLSVSHSRLARLFLQLEDTEAGKQALEAALAIDEELVAVDPANMSFRRDLAGSHSALADLYLQLGDFAAGLRSLETARVIREELVALDPANMRFQRDLSVSLGRLSNIHFRLGDLAAALHTVEASLRISEALAALDPEDRRGQRDLAVTYYQLYEVHQRMGEIAQALTYATAANEILVRMRERSILLIEDETFIAATAEAIRTLREEPGEAEDPR